MYTERFRSWIDTSCGSNVSADAIRVDTKFMSNDPEMTDEQLVDEINLI